MSSVVLALTHLTRSFVHWGCAPETMVGKLKASCSTPEEIEGFSELKEAEQEKVKRAWEGGAIPDEDQGPGEPVASEKKKAPAKRAKKDADDDDREKPAKKRARKAKVCFVVLQYSTICSLPSTGRRTTMMTRKRKSPRSSRRR